MKNIQEALKEHEKWKKLGNDRYWRRRYYPTPWFLKPFEYLNDLIPPGPTERVPYSPLAAYLLSKGYSVMDFRRTIEIEGIKLHFR